jgi:P pilus assembly chaperone PapD
LKPASLLGVAALAVALLTTSSSAQPTPAPAGAPAATPTAVPVVTNVGANINISPRRVTLDVAHRTATVTVFNQGTGPGTFRISLVDRVMTPEGQIIAVSELPGHPEIKPQVDRLHSAAQLVRVAPMRVTLAPGQNQIIKLQLIAPPDASGESRTHLTVATVPPPTSGITAEAAAGANPNALSFQINAVFGISIPVIVRAGPADATAKLENARIETGVGPNGAKQTQLVVDIVRTGASSLFGNVEVKPVGKKAETIGLARGVGVYTEIDRRTLRLTLARAPAVGEKLQVSFTDDDTSPGKVLATLVL